jgi:hypothetical protein
MWEHYKKTFVGIQMVILLVAGAVMFWTHQLGLAALFFATMQVGAVVGATWAQRLKTKLAPHAGSLPQRGN